MCQQSSAASPMRHKQIYATQRQQQQEQAIHSISTTMIVQGPTRRNKKHPTFIYYVVTVLVFVGIIVNSHIINNFVSSSTSPISNTSVADYLFPCGDWSPTASGGLIDPSRFNSSNHFPTSSLTNLEDSDEIEIPSCRITSVGKTISLPTDRLYCSPNVTAAGRAAPILALDLKLSPSYNQPEFSIISPSFNVAEVLRETAPTLCQTVTGSWEVIFVLDNCFDNSLDVLREVLLSSDCIGNNNSTLVRARVVLHPTSVYETSSDNTGFLLANPTHFIIDVQADMFLKGKGWNHDLSRPFFEYNDIVSISGRCGHSQEVPVTSYKVGRCGRDVAALNTEEETRMKDAVYVTATNIRGPLMFRADALKELGYLDERNYFLGNDDHDFNRRANFHGWKASYKYAKFFAPLNMSATRNSNFMNVIPDRVKQYNKEYKTYRQSASKSSTCGTNKDSAGFSSTKPTEKELRKLPTGVINKEDPLPPLPELFNLI